MVLAFIGMVLAYGGLSFRNDVVLPSGMDDKPHLIRVSRVVQNGRQSCQYQIDMLSFPENIKYKTKYTFPSDTNIVYRCVLLICWTALVYKFHFATKQG